MKGKVRFVSPIILILIIVSTLITIATAFFNWRLFYICLAILVVGLVIVLFKLRRLNKDVTNFLRYVGDTLTSVQQNAISNFPIPVLVANNEKKIVWYNDIYRTNVLDGQDKYGDGVETIIGTIDLSKPCRRSGYNVLFGEKYYNVYYVRSKRPDGDIYLIYMIDNTELRMYMQEYLDSRLSVMLIMIDNYDEIVKDAKENEKSQIMASVEYTIENFVEVNQGLLVRIATDQFIAFIEERHMREIVKRRFEILDKIRMLTYADKMPVTLSIGVGRSEGGLAPAEQNARQALDMCLGRGGDQVAVKTKNGYDFYGGISKGVEKRNRVKTRIVANALSELIDSSENVLIMGHNYADLDCLGSATAIAKIVSQRGKHVAIVLNKAKCLAAPLLNKLLKNGYSHIIVEPDQALQLIGKKTLLIIVDTHVKNFLESQAVYDACKHVVVIDHHRKMVNHIDNAVIFYHEPLSSSASEMVSELVQYFGNNSKLGRLEAEALLAGITLDTKNFIMKTGVRTFEAAAYLRKLGADTVEVRKMFSSNMNAYKKKAQLVSSAHLYHDNCAIAVCGDRIEGVKVVAAQAADELLNIEHVDASFVVFNDNGVSCISARSMGEVNVQLIMEAMGGGGHLTMAATQLPEVSIEQTLAELKKAIDMYFVQRNNDSK